MWIWTQDKTILRKFGYINGEDTEKKYTIFDIFLCDIYTYEHKLKAQRYKHQCIYGCILIFSTFPLCFHIFHFNPKSTFYNYL